MVSDLFVCFFFDSFGFCRFVGILENFSEIIKLFGNFGNFPETELVEVLLGRASFRTHPKAVLVIDYV